MQRRGGVRTDDEKAERRGGFMGKKWDSAVPGAEFWEAALRVVKPGAYLLAFGGTRTFHRLACAIEDAGWEVQDTLSWLYGSGFPKHASKLKPAWEPIILARRPAPRATPLQIDACRIAGPPSVGGGMGGSLLGIMNDDGWEPKALPIDRSMAAGRWPANVVLDEDAAAALDAMAPRAGASAPVRGTEPSAASVGRVTGERARVPGAFHGDAGGASRFFYCAKASRSEREAGLDGLPTRPVRRYGEQGQGPLPQQTPRTERPAANGHPTVKPLALMRWLCRLVTPPGGLVLDPFCGSGSTGVAAIAEGFRFVGCEREAEYAEIARARIAHAVQVQPMLEGVA